MPPTKAHFELHIPQAGLTRRPCDTALVWSTDYVSPVINIPIFLSLHSTHKQFFFFLLLQASDQAKSQALEQHGCHVSHVTAQLRCRSIRLPMRPHRSNQRHGSAPERSGGGIPQAPLPAVVFQRASEQVRGGWEGNAAPIKVQAPFREIAGGD